MFAETLKIVLYNSKQLSTGIHKKKRKLTKMNKNQQTVYLAWIHLEIWQDHNSVVGKGKEIL